MALTAIRRLGLAGAAVPVVLGGSLLAAADPLLTGLVTAGLAAGAPAAVPRIVDVPRWPAPRCSAWTRPAPPGPRTSCAPRSAAR